MARFRLLLALLIAVTLSTVAIHTAGLDDATATGASVKHTYTLFRPVTPVPILAPAPFPDQSAVPSNLFVQLDASGNLMVASETPGVGQNTAATFNNTILTVDASGNLKVNCTGCSSGVVTAITYYVCAKANGGTCVYNGDAGTVAATISDSNNCTTKATPCATIAGAVAKFASQVLEAVVTVQLADTAGTGTDCYRPNAVTVSQITMGWSNGAAYNFDALSGGGDGETDAYPVAYVYFLGDTTTPGNVIVSGANSCAGTTETNGVGFYVNHTHVRFNGMKFQYFGPTATVSGAAVVTNNSLALMENITGLANNTANQNTAIVKARNMSLLRVAGTWNVTNASAFWAMNSILDDKTPLGCVSLTFTGNGTYTGKAIQIEELGKEYIDCGTYSFAGTGAYFAWDAQDIGEIYFNDGANVTFTFNDSNLTVAKALVNSIIQLPMCAAGFNITCTPTAFSRYAYARSGSTIYLGGTSGSGSAEADNLADSGGMVIRDWFGDTLGRTWGATQAGRLAVEGLRGLSKSVTVRQNIEGSCAFSAGTTCAVSFGTAEPDANFDIFVDTPANIGAIWVTAKATSGFTINCVTSNSSTVRWVLIGR